MNNTAPTSALNHLPALAGRVAERVVVLTGAAGNIGTHISRRLLAEGAHVVLSGRDAAKLAGFVDTLAAEGYDRGSMEVVVGDCADPATCRAIVAAAVARWGRVDVLVNNAGSAGPKRTLRNIAFTTAEKKALGDDETMLDAAMNLLGGPWHMVRAAVAHMPAGGSIINVSTIFSRTRYYGRIPYVVPKAALNLLSAGLASELGERHGIRVNTVYPGPIESARIDHAFAAMDALQGLPDGSTSREFRALMTNRRCAADGSLDFRYPGPSDVAATVLWLASDESAAFAGQAFEVTNGMQVPMPGRSQLVSWPDDRLVDLAGRVILVLGGDNLEEAMVFVERHLSRGARVVLCLRALDLVSRAGARLERNRAHGLQVHHLDPLRPETSERVFQFLHDHHGRLDGVVVLPACGNGAPDTLLCAASDAEVAAFIEREIVAPVAFAAQLTRTLAGWTPRVAAPAVTFVTPADDGNGNRFNEIRRAAIEALIRGWRDEEQHEVERGEWGWNSMPNQLVRFGNREPDNLAFAADWTATLNYGARKMDAIDLWVPASIQRATGKTAMPQSIQRVLPGLHHGRTALITGGSLGIGMQLGRYLAMAGARVLLAARSAEKLAAAREQIVAELTRIGYADPHGRVCTIADIDVGDEAALQRLYDYTVETFGDLDFLINNAGIAGAEEMVVDMGLDAWGTTMEANLVSNYSLIRKFAPRMKARGRGVILNVSSYFGGEKYVAVPYPNRADYAVSKAGQRALAEILSRHLGPEIQINAMAPGPVDGARLRGSSGAPGLFDRRGRLILENIRLNQVHRAVLAAGPGPDLLEKLAGNRLDALLAWPQAPAPLRRLCAQFAAGQSGATAASWLLSDDGARKLVARLLLSAHIEAADGERYLDDLKSAPTPFFDETAVAAEARKVEAAILDLLHLHRMPTDEEVSLSTVFSLADRSVSGETFHPSGGLKFDRSVTEGEMMLRPGSEDLRALAGKHVVLVGDSMREELVAIAEGFCRFDVARITVLTRSPGLATALGHTVTVPDGMAFSARAVGDALEDGLRAVLRDHGAFDVVVNTPFARLPLKPLAGEAGDASSWERVLSRDDFAALVRDHLTHHFRVARVAALVPRCQIVLVTPDTSRASTREEFALAMFIKTAMHAFTVTLGVEGERLPTVPAVNQVQLTRRARAEEPGNEQELAEEMERLVYAVLQCAVPAPSPAESRYLSRIFRGNALTV